MMGKDGSTFNDDCKSCSALREKLRDVGKLADAIYDNIPEGWISRFIAEKAARAVIACLEAP